jgi:hypothetical protein
MYTELTREEEVLKQSKFKIARFQERSQKGKNKTKNLLHFLKSVSCVFSLFAFFSEQMQTQITH